MSGHDNELVSCLRSEDTSGQKKSTKKVSWAPDIKPFQRLASKPVWVNAVQDPELVRDLDGIGWVGTSTVHRLLLKILDKHMGGCSSVAKVQGRICAYLNIVESDRKWTIPFIQNVIQPAINRCTHPKYEFCPTCLETWGRAETLAETCKRRLIPQPKSIDADEAQLLFSAGNTVHSNSLRKAAMAAMATPFHQSACRKCKTIIWVPIWYAKSVRPHQDAVDYFMHQAGMKKAQYKLFVQWVR